MTTVLTVIILLVMTISIYQLFRGIFEIILGISLFLLAAALQAVICCAFAFEWCWNSAFGD